MSIDSAIEQFKKAGKYDAYEGKPDQWNVLGQNADPNASLKLQKEIKDVRVLQRMYDQIDDYIQDKDDILNKKYKDQVEYPATTKYEK